MIAEPALCVSAVVVDDERLLLVRRGRGAAQGTWACPGGRVAPGETIAEAVVRELLEETGVEGLCGPLLGIVELVDDQAPHVVILAHEVTVLDPIEPVAGDDAAEAAWVPVGEVAERQLAPGLAELLHDHQVIATIT